MLKLILSTLRKYYDSFRYDDVTIADKFRKQGAKIGKGCFIQIRSLAAEPYLVEIGDNVSIAQRVKLVTHDGASVILRDEFPALRYFGKIIIEDNCFIGEDSFILPGVRIGKGSIVGPLSVVLRDVKPGSMVIGNPAIQVSTVEKYRERCLEEWKNQGLDKFDHLFEGKDKFEVQAIMLSQEFRERLREHLSSISFERKGKIKGEQMVLK
jgi:acetyltransferase-like isoleucine patch superfamily enzyme